MWLPPNQQRGGYQPQMQGRQSPTGSMQPQQQGMGGGGTMGRSGGSPFGAMGRAMGGFMGGMGRGMLGGGSSGGNKWSQFQKPQPPMGGIGPSMQGGMFPPMIHRPNQGPPMGGWDSPQGRDQAKLSIGSMFSGTGQPAPWQLPQQGNGPPGGYDMGPGGMTGKPQGPLMGSPYDSSREYMPRQAPPGQATTMDMIRNPNYQGGIGPSQGGFGQMMQNIMQQQPYDPNYQEPAMVNNGWGKMIPREEAEAFRRGGGVA